MCVLQRLAGGRESSWWIITGLAAVAAPAVARNGSRFELVTWRARRVTGSAAGHTGVRGTQAVGAVFGHLGGADGWYMATGCATTTTGRQSCWVLQTRPDLTPFIQVRSDLSDGEVRRHLYWSRDNGKNVYGHSLCHLCTHAGRLTAPATIPDAP